MDIKYVIQQRGLLMSQAAEMMGITPQALSQIVNGNPTVKKIEMLAKAIGCSPAEFFSDWQQPEEHTGDAEPYTVSPTTMPPTPPEKPDDLPFNGGSQQQAEQVRAVRFTYGCPHCGHQVTVTIE